MFSATGLFSKIVCPVDDQCDLPNCLFRHVATDDQRAWGCMEETEEMAPKRRKTTRPIDTKPEASLPLFDISSGQPTPPAELSDGELQDEHRELRIATGFVGEQKPLSRERSISPPTLRREKPASVPTKSMGPFRQPPVRQETLNPRMLQRDPAKFSTRLLYLRKLHEGISRLNNETIASKDPDVSALALTAGQVITMALDEEEKLAREKPEVYANVIKLRMLAYKKMTLDQWKVARLEEKMKDTPVPAQPHLNEDRPIVTGLTDSQERVILRRLLAAQHGLERHGYVTSPPTTGEVVAAREGVECSRGWEKCERCDIRFQVFPDRRENGALTSGGACTYHPGRVQGTPERKVHDCCGEPLGITIGCTQMSSHVYKIYDGKRLASLMQFGCTPDNRAASADSAITFDCEMAFTVNGMELIRLTANAWPSSELLLDLYVRPLGQILDWNTRFSGVGAEDFAKAKPFDFSGDESENTALRLVESPATARELLFRLLTPSTPLIGHAIENDLNVTRIIHPCIVDTVLLFPHARGLPFRQSLKRLAKDILWRDIQANTGHGHDSIEDAKATGDLVRVKVGREWEKMKRNGWKLEEGDFMPPPPSVNIRQPSKKRAHDSMDVMILD
ncbi:MAG: RNA exonuclease 3 [Chrysothrix sp. TS-e1954]|nr:MAG: RNA exonuclease 3 [Chrysothrix sp. TS-e1954]